MRNSRRAGKPAGRKPEKQGLTGLFTKGKNIPTTAQQTLPYREMYRDGVCRVADRYYTKTIEYEDINYQLAQSEDQAAIFDGWSACLNYFDSSLPFQLSFLNHRSRPGSRYSVNIPISNAGAYVRKMALNGYILHIDLAPVKELISLQRRCSNNLNQVAIHAHTYGVYPEEIDGLKRDYEKLWGEVSKVLRELSELVAK